MTIPNLSDRLTAALHGRYAIEREIGSGGMAIVFAARDRRHNRTVAIKVLRPELTASVGADRFVREIELAAGLQHPHILPVYDSGAVDGIFYYVMPFVEGEALSDRIARDGPLPVEDAVRFAAEISGALAYAHARGIIHRDIKPDNVMLSVGHALVADFGIARAVDAGAGRLTATGMAVGSPMYMSPEQALGSSDVDARSDVYSLGCVLYEMLTARQPFSGTTLQAIVAQSITAPRPRARKVRRDVPASLEALVVRALATEPADRFQTAAELADALSAPFTTRAVSRRPRWMAGAAVAAIVTVGAAASWGWRARVARAADAVAHDARVIAVLPFTAAGDQTTGMSEGLVDLVSTNLDGVGGIRVIDPRTALGRWRARAGAAVTLDRPASLSVGREVNAGAVLTGTVVTLGSRIRVSAELVAIDGTSLARAQADGPPDSVLSIVDTLSVRLLRDVWRAASPLPELRVSELTTGSLPAIRAYLEGEQQRRRSNWAAAEQAYSRAIEHDSSFALAYLRLLTANEWLGVDVTSRRALVAAIRPRLDRLSARERGLAIGQLLYHEGKLAAFDSALALTTRYPDALDAWMLLGETRYHAQASLAPTPSEIRAPFERVLGFDASLTSVVAHLLHVSVMFGDSAQFFRDLARMGHTAGDADTTVALYRLVGNAVWGTPTTSADAMHTIITRRPAYLHLIAQGSLNVPDASARLIAGIRQSAGTARGDSALYDGIALLLATGRVAEARRTRDELLATLPEFQGAYRLGWAPYFMGIADSSATFDALRSAIRKWSGGSYGLVSRAELAVATRDTTAVRGVVELAVATDTTRLPARFHMIFDVMRGWAKLARGDTAAGVRAMSAVLAGGDFTLQTLTKDPRFVRAVALSRAPATRAEGVRLLRYGFANDPEFFGATQLALCDALLATGDRAGAAAARATFERLWARSDATARAQAERAYPRAFAR